MIANDLATPLVGTATGFAADLVEGLSRPAKELPAKYFYDERGSRLFDLICELPEYYPTRTELDIMETWGGEMAALLGPRCVVVEYGSGSSLKTRVLLRELDRPAGYVPVDISREPLLAAAAALRERFPAIPIRPVCGDFTAHLALPLEGLQPARRAVYFPGSTIGNFHPPEAVGLLRHIASQAGPGGALLIGVDLRKDPAVLEAAYNDRLGVTAAFNLNLLARANRELGADFDLDRFRHRAFFDRVRSRIEMHLVSVGRQEVHALGRAFRFEDGESIHTESSYKYGPGEFVALAARAGFRQGGLWVDDERLFSVHFLAL
ncbi:L-histidine N(alpha)-methyltransferase [Anaeromyxobacter paludicola]|uniref:Dimethylhistidine N-methyltransferase n=1 Tax=Anaeromyxobacter paludicola TaxID=2918171 RepID=A0ABN6N7V9_9BACT|nr:L-histidine N(alpha)-methyltransferase [Anaeromyxobacter paludicola]BDG07933.1 dimethylhistidine N-methyltransferase [Anaeromyxobacter paludicola]